MIPSTSRVLQGLQKQLNQLDGNLKNSFSNLKEDLSKQAKEIQQLKFKLAKQEAINRRLAKDIAAPILKKPDNHTLSHEAFGNHSVRSVKRSFGVRRTPNTHTPLHLEMLKRLMLLQMESTKRFISMRELAADLYPTKAYTSVKSTLSEYIKKLNQEGLVEKFNNGRLYVSYTKKSLQYADNHRLNRMKELISKSM